MATVVHPFLKDGVQARAYQMKSLKSALTSSTLMVMPTGFGKTAVEWMAMAEALRLKRGKVLLIAPTTGLVDQQRRMATEMLNLDADAIVSYTGEVGPAKRPPLWAKGQVVMATSQVIRNDAVNGIIDLTEVGLLIVDGHTTAQETMPTLKLATSTSVPSQTLLSSGRQQVPDLRRQTFSRLPEGWASNAWTCRKKRIHCSLPTR